MREYKTQLTKFGLYLMMRGIDRKDLSASSGVGYTFICSLCRTKTGTAKIPTTYSHTFYPGIQKLMKVLKCQLSDII